MTKLAGTPIPIDDPAWRPGLKGRLWGMSSDEGLTGRSERGPEELITACMQARYRGELHPLAHLI